jgi:hypothetical protein
MSVLTDVKARLTGLAHAEKDRYAGNDDRPLGGYVGALATYTTVVGTLAALARITGREIPDGLAVKDLVLSAVATQKLSRLITRDPVTSPLRAPFTVYQGTEGPAELKEGTRGHGAQKVIGELITCPFCIDMWVATGLVATPWPCWRAPTCCSSATPGCRSSEEAKTAASVTARSAERPR